MFEQAQQARAEQRPGRRANEDNLPPLVADAVGGAGAQGGVEAIAQRIGQHLAQQMHGQAKGAPSQLNWIDHRFNGFNGWRRFGRPLGLPACARKPDAFATCLYLLKSTNKSGCPMGSRFWGAKFVV